MPSDLLGIRDDPLTAYNLNNAVWFFGTSLDNALNENPKPGKEERKEQQRRTRILDRWIPKAPDAPEPEKPRRAFAEPKVTKRS